MFAHGRKRALSAVFAHCAHHLSNAHSRPWARPLLTPVAISAPCVNVVGYIILPTTGPILDERLNKCPPFPNLPTNFDYDLF